MRTNLYEILNKFKLLKTKQERIQFLKSQPDPIKHALYLTYHPDTKFYPKSFPKEYKKPDTFPGISISNIPNELKRLYLFQIGNEIADKLTEEKRKILLLQLLESLEPDEATMLINMFNKNLKIPNLTYNLIKETFPEMFP